MKVSHEELTRWREALAECDNIDKFNGMALPLAREKRGHFARFVAGEAKRRGYLYIGDKSEGFYAWTTPEQYATMMKELDRRDRRECNKRLRKALRSIWVSQVQASWEEWVYKTSGGASLGTILILDFRKRKDNLGIYEYDQVPRELFERLFQPDAKVALAQIYKMYAGQESKEVRDHREAF